MDNLKFRRQFLFSSKPTEKLKKWTYQKIGNNHLYVHPDLNVLYLNRGREQFVLLGYWLDPHSAKKNNYEILNEISEIYSNENEFFNYLNKIVGRFVLFAIINDSYNIFHDPCGLRTVYYSINKDGIYFASQPKLFELCFELRKNQYYNEYFDSDYVKRTKEHWLPSGITLFENVHQLVPNHYLDVDLNKQVRFWPTDNLNAATISADEGAEKLSVLLENTMIAANKRFKLALAVTSGLDSRLLLSSVSSISESIYYYTLKYRNLDNDSPDIKIPKKLLEKMRLNHHVIDCTGFAEEKFLKTYIENTANSHLDDWGTIAFGIQKEFPADYVAVKANCVEISRSSSLRDISRFKKVTMKHIMDIVPQWKEFSFIKPELSKWFAETNSFTRYGYHIRELFYMEHRVGSWQAQSQLEWDISQEVFVPFNNREVINIMLSVKPKFRSKKNISFFIKTIDRLNSQLLSEPINPKSFYEKVKGFLKTILTFFGLLKLFKKLY
ncbi:hypothetical protein [Maribacter litoralis]|uniref:hypothetical protein n=1 Tax=Maribacter litoralis TaxID=2059726 RepID=UPI003F5CEA17